MTTTLRDHPQSVEQRGLWAVRIITVLLMVKSLTLKLLKSHLFVFMMGLLGNTVLKREDCIAGALSEIYQVNDS